MAQAQCVKCGTSIPLADLFRMHAAGACRGGPPAPGAGVGLVVLIQKTHPSNRQNHG